MGRSGALRALERLSDKGLVDLTKHESGRGIKDSLTEGGKAAMEKNMVDCVLRNSFVQSNVVDLSLNNAVEIAVESAKPKHNFMTLLYIGKNPQMEHTQGAVAITNTSFYQSCIY